jgi:GNAT superfamily N-acetyltransferase
VSQPPPVEDLPSTGFEERPAAMMEAEGRAAGWGIAYRPATVHDLAACGEIWRDAINDYTGRLNQLPVGDDLAPIARLHTHLRDTDPDRFRVATRGDRVVAFGSAAMRGNVWFLSMLFVRPAEQGSGIGRTLLRQLLPEDGTILATSTDSAQPISNGLYASIGIVPRMPLLSLVGRPTRWAELPALPPDVHAVPFERVETGEAGLRAPGPGSASRTLSSVLGDLDRQTLGFDHMADHAWLRGERRQGFLYRSADGSVVGYGYSSAVGRVGPVAVRQPDLLTPVVAHLLGAIEPRGASAIWMPGDAAAATTALLRAGLRFESFPVLLCWNRGFADFERYLPISPGLL